MLCLCRVVLHCAVCGKERALSPVLHPPLSFSFFRPQVRLDDGFESLQGAGRSQAEGESVRAQGRGGGRTLAVPCLTPLECELLRQSRGRGGHRPA